MPTLAIRVRLLVGLLSVGGVFGACASGVVDTNSAPTALGENADVIQIELKQYLAAVSDDVDILPEAKNDPGSFLKYIDEGRFFLIELSDGSKWQIAASFYAYARQWKANDPITITHHDFEPSEQFKLVNSSSSARDLWNNPQEVWGRPEGGLSHLEQFAPKNRRHLASVNETDSQVVFNDGSAFLIKSADVLSLDHVYYIISNDDPEWPYAIWNLSGGDKYDIVEARPVVPAQEDI